MATKTYGIWGLQAAVYPLTVDGVTVRASFKGGITDPLRQRPAQLVTNDPLVQLVIEKHPLFKSGRIKLLTVYGPIVNEKEKNKVMEKAKTSKGKATSKTINSNMFETESGYKVYPDVKTSGDAANVLLDLGVSMKDLKDETAILDKAIDLKIQFPNYGKK
jgi:hypothetical protein